MLPLSVPPLCTGCGCRDFLSFYIYTQYILMDTWDWDRVYYVKFRKWKKYSFSFSVALIIKISILKMCRHTEICFRNRNTYIYFLKAMWLNRKKKACKFKLKDGLYYYYHAYTSSFKLFCISIDYPVNKTHSKLVSLRTEVRIKPSSTATSTKSLRLLNSFTFYI